MTDVVYLEQQTTHAALPASGAVVTLGLLSAPLFDPPAWVHATTLSLALLVILVVWSFSTLTISLDGGLLRFGFGWFRRTVPLTGVRSVTLTEARIAEMFRPAGRRGRGTPRRCFVARSGSAIEVATDRVVFVVSSGHAGRLADLLARAAGGTPAPEPHKPGRTP